jgi:hypothetical protein
MVVQTSIVAGSHTLVITSGVPTTGISYANATTGAKEWSQEEEPPQPPRPTAAEQEEADLLAAIQVGPWLRPSDHPILC